MKRGNATAGKCRKPTVTTSLVLAASFLLMPLASAGQGTPAPAAARPGFMFEDVVRRAQALAAAPFDATVPSLPNDLGKLDYDHYRGILFRSDKSLMADRGGFLLQLLHLGFIYKRPVVVDTVRDGIASPIAYASNLFEVLGNKFTSPFPINLGFAGFRLLYPLQTPTRMDEAISFLGGSYFRFLGRNNIYGLSARGLAIKTGLAEPEEFPFFREFWVVQPEANAGRIVVYALLDSASVTGAYHFTIVPGKETVVDVAASLFPRTKIDQVGIAPLTSMFFTGENDHRLQGNDFRPEVHDSDGVLLHNGNNEWVWRPVRNPPERRISEFFDTDPRGFGLMQRDHRFDHYEDLEARYSQRPSYWIEPQDKWGEGAVDLVELPASHEGYDNIVLYWRPKAPLSAGQRVDLHYKISTVGQTGALHDLGFAAATFETTPNAGKSPAPDPSTLRRFLVDFTGGDLAYYLADVHSVKVDASTSVGRVVASSLVPNRYLDGFRVSLDVQVDPGRTADLRIILRAGNRPLTETWTYGWTSPASVALAPAAPALAAPAPAAPAPVTLAPAAPAPVAPEKPPSAAATPP